MPCKAMNVSLDSHNPPLYAISQNGRFYLLAVEDMPCLTLTSDGLDEIQNADRLPMDALPQIDIRTAPPSGDDYGGF